MAVAKQGGSSSVETSAPWTVVGIGASAGGLRDLERFLAAVTPTGIAYVVVQQATPDHPSIVPRFLAATCHLPVEAITDRCLPWPDRVYLAPPNASLVLREGRLRLEPPEARTPNHPIDLLFESLANALGGRAVAVVMSGAGSDGAAGLRVVKRAGGLTLVQTPGEAERDAMPRAAISTTDVDYVVPVAEMPALITRELVRRAAESSTGSMTLPKAPASGTLVGVSRFFRDPEAFAALAREVAAPLLARSARQPLRIWVPACVTGEEAYSIAILLREEARRRGASIPVLQVFATDLDEETLSTARRGIYPTTIEQDLAREVLDRHFEAVPGGYEVKKALRDAMIFSPHDVLADPPFSRLDLVSCRNLPIYFHPAVQQRLVPLFHYALRPQGYLFLGEAGTADEPSDLIEPVDAKHRIFLRREPVERLPVPMPLARGLPRGVPRLREGTSVRLRSAEEGRGESEELRSANDYLQAMNEELQSANEELRVSHEDLQSVNQELHTLNAELSQKVERLDRDELALKEVDRRRSEFVGVLSHELRSPLAAIGASLHLALRSAPGWESLQRSLAVAIRQVQQLTRLTDDLLDVTRISSGKMRLRREQADVVAIAQHTAEDHRATFASAEVALDVETPPEALFVFADPIRLAQMIGNLLQNAVKFTGKGGRASLRVAREGEEALITLADTGAGIAPDVLPLIFEPFVQSERMLDRNPGGLGLGLALVRALARLQGGEASATSGGLAQGAIFTLRLPLDRRRTLRPALPPSAYALVPRRILVIEDSVDAAESLAEVLRLEGHYVETALSGPQGLEAARRMSPEVVLCDIGLPGMDGFEVARGIRAEPALRGIRLIALSGYAQSEDVERAMAAGFDLHVPKPPDFDLLERSIAAP